MLKRKIVSVLISIFMFINMLVPIVSAALPGALLAPSNILESGQCGDNLWYEIADEGNINVLTIGGTGEMWDFSYALSPLVSSYHWDGIHEYSAIVINEGVTSIGKNAFSEGPSVN